MIATTTRRRRTTRRRSNPALVAAVLVALFFFCPFLVVVRSQQQGQGAVDDDDAVSSGAGTAPHGDGVGVGGETRRLRPDEGERECELLSSSLAYTQEEAPADLSTVLPVVVERVNRELRGVVDVRVEWTGADFQGLVGDHTVQCEVTRLASAVVAVAAADDDDDKRHKVPQDDDEGEPKSAEAEAEPAAVVTQCFLVPFRIVDTNECALPAGHAMRHKCHDSAVCINTEGSYECACPRLVEDEDGEDDDEDDEEEDEEDGEEEEEEDEDDEDEEARGRRRKKRQRRRRQQLEAGSTQDAAFFQSLEEEGRSPWEVSYNQWFSSSCPSRASTFGCCPARVRGNENDEDNDNDNDQHDHRASSSSSSSSCRANFRCPVDPCTSRDKTKKKKMNDCCDAAACRRAASPADHPAYTCECPAGLLGHGRECRAGVDPEPNPTVMFDGVTPTAETVRNNYYCCCTAPTVDPCSGFPACQGEHEVCTVNAQKEPVCACRTGYVMHDTYGCVDESPPVLKLRNDYDGTGVLRLKQGDAYTEYAVDVVNDRNRNAEDYLRSLKIAYSQPLPAGGCLLRTGQFRVKYTVATPWTTPPYAQVTRTVQVDDVNECELSETALSEHETACPDLVPRCDAAAGAVCVNTVGSYTCRCPKYTTGDGFLPNLDGAADVVSNVPEGYQGGTGCRDDSPPVIEVLEPNPKVFRACQCGGVTGIMMSGGRSSNRVSKRDGHDRAAAAAAVRKQQQELYGSDIKELVRSTSGAELCATRGRPNPANGTDCVRAYDRTHAGTVDLSERVRIGEPVRQSPLHWIVPYNVRDDAGNDAETAYRDVRVEEVCLSDIAEQNRLREESVKNAQEEMDAAVRAAVAAERKKWIEEQEQQEQQSPQPAVTSAEQERRRTTNRRAASSSSGENNSNRSCPECPPCDCHEGGGKRIVDESACHDICRERLSQQSKNNCTTEEYDDVGDDYTQMYRTMSLWLGRYLPPYVVSSVIFLTCSTVVFIFLRWTCTVLFNPPALYNKATAAANADLVNDADFWLFADAKETSGGGGGVSSSSAKAATAPAAAPAPLSANDFSFFTPNRSPQQMMMRGNSSTAIYGSGSGSGGSPLTYSAGHWTATANGTRGGGSSLLEDSPIITPSKTGDGVRKRTAFTVSR